VHCGLTGTRVTWEAGLRIHTCHENFLRGDFIVITGTASASANIS